jgi:hypothetical protein
MNKTLHVFVYLFLILAAAGLFFEFQLNEKRALLTARNKMQEEYITKLAATIECVEPEGKDVVAEVNKDVSPVEAKEVDSPSYDNLLQDYKAYLEQDNLKTYEWVKNQEIIQQLRAVYALDAEGKVAMDGNTPRDYGPGTERELLDKLLKSSQNQQATLNTTRAEMKSLHGKLADTVNELNEQKKENRRDKVTIVEREQTISTLEGEKAQLEDKVVKQKAQIDELDTENSALKEDITAKDEEIAARQEDLVKCQKQLEQVTKILQETLQTRGDLSKPGSDAAISSLPFGDKGKIVMADNENMFAIVEFTPEAMSQLKGDDKNRPLPMLELGVKRAGFKGEAGEFVGRIRIKQEVAGKNYVVCDILANWEQSKLKANDVVFAD